MLGSPGDRGSRDFPADRTIQNFPGLPKHQELWRSALFSMYHIVLQN